MILMLLTAAGFTSAGIAAGSAAAAWQATMPLVAGGSLFAFLQSVGAGGTGASGVLSVGSVLGAIGAFFFG